MNYFKNTGNVLEIGTLVLALFMASDLSSHSIVFARDKGVSRGIHKHTQQTESGVGRSRQYARDRRW